MTNEDDTFNKLRKQTFEAMVEMAEKVPPEVWRNRTPKEHAEWFEPTGWTFEEFRDAERDYNFTNAIAAVMKLEDLVKALKEANK